MKKPYKTQTGLAAILILLAATINAQQLCTATDTKLLNSLASNNDFIDYVCPADRKDCMPDQLAQQVEIKAIRLSPETPTKSKSAEETCIVVPNTKGRQFPSLVFKSNAESVQLLAEDWDSGLKVIPKVCGGKFILEGRAISGPGEIEIYRLKWQKKIYSEYSRKCYRVRAVPEPRRDELIPVKCQ